MHRCNEEASVEEGKGDSLALQKLLLLLSVGIDQLLGNQLHQFQTFLDLHQHLEIFPTSDLTKGEKRGDHWDLKEAIFIMHLALLCRLWDYSSHLPAPVVGKTGGQR